MTSRRAWRWLLFATIVLWLAAVCGALWLSTAFAATRHWGPWSDKVRLVVLMDKSGPLTRSGRTLWAIQTPVTYTTHDNETITIPAGMVTDLASIPRVAAGVFPPDGPWVSAAVVHDFLYETRGECVYRGHVFRSLPRPYTRAEADGLLRDAMTDLGVPRWQVWAIYTAVRVGGAGGWGH